MQIGLECRPIRFKSRVHTLSGLSSQWLPWLRLTLRLRSRREAMLSAHKEREGLVAEVGADVHLVAVPCDAQHLVNSKQARNDEIFTCPVFHKR